MRLMVALLSVVALGAPAEFRAQTRRPPPAPRQPSPPPPPPAPVNAVPEITCPAPLGVGVTTKRAFCDVLSARDPAEGVLIPLPPHVGPVTLIFDLHNRHTYSEEQVRANKGYARYTATIGVMTMDNTLITRAAVQNEFRKAADLVDRIAGGAGPGGLKAVAPTGTAHIVVTIPEEEQQVSLLGEKLTVERLEGPATYSSPGRPVAVVSNIQIEYVPPPPPKPPSPPRRRPVRPAAR